MPASSSKTTSQAPHDSMPRTIGIWNACLLGLGSILGTGVYVSLAVATEVAGSAVVYATIVAALIAVFNGLSSAQLAANHPVSGGTYEYAYRWLGALPGFTAGWTFLLAKSASASTAALGCASYLVQSIGSLSDEWVVPIAVAISLSTTLLVSIGIRSSQLTNAVQVLIAVVALLVFVIWLSPTALRNGQGGTISFSLIPTDGSILGPSFLQACALMFVAYTGYGRIATLGEEIRRPRQTIPLAIISTLALAMFLYVAVSMVAIATVGSDAFASSDRSRFGALERVAKSQDFQLLAWIVTIGAVAGMGSVLLNLVLGLSRVLLAMGRRADMPVIVGQLTRKKKSPIVAVWTVGSCVTLLTLSGDVKTTWTFSAWAVLIYYAITNLCALQLTTDQRLFPRWTAVCGLIACSILTLWIPGKTWFVGCGSLLAGGVWFLIAQRLKSKPSA